MIVNRGTVEKTIYQVISMIERKKYKFERVYKYLKINLESPYMYMNMIDVSK